MFLKRVLLIFIVPCVCAAVFSPQFERDLNAYIENSMKCRHVPGMTLSVVKGDDVWSSVYGKEDIYLDKDVDAKSKFNIGSVTKSFTATLLGMLLSEKGFNWSSPVTDVLGPGYGFIDDYRTKNLMLRDLLSHRTGLAALEVLDAGISKSISRQEYCKRMKDLPAQAPVRDVFIYNNLMYMMLGHVAEVLGQDTWENLVKQKIFEPLGMNDTSIMETPNDIFTPGVAQPYLYVDGQYLNGTYDVYEIYPAEPAGAIISTGADMAKWVKLQLNLGKTESGLQLIDKELMKDMHRLTTPIASLGEIKSLTKPTFPVDDIFIGYGYAWFISEYRGYRNVWHSGGLGAYRTMLWTFPDMNIGLFASINGPTIGGDAYFHRVATFYYLADHLLGLSPWLNHTTACSLPKPWAELPKTQSPRLETPITVTNLADFEGSYTNSLSSGFEISSNSTNLFLKSNKVGGILHPSSEKDRFLYEVLYPLEFALVDTNVTVYTNVTFARNAPTDAVNSLTINVGVDLTYNKKPTAPIVG